MLASSALRSLFLDFFPEAAAGAGSPAPEPQPEQPKAEEPQAEEPKAEENDPFEDIFKIFQNRD